MRFLCSFAGGYGHAAPLFPLARALIQRGHAVAFTGQKSVLPAVIEAGFETYDRGGTMVVQPAAHSKFQPFDERRLKERMQGNFGDYIARERLAGVLQVAAAWQPDAIICDELDFGGMLAAERLGIPHVTTLVIASGRLVTPEWFADPIDRIRADHGLPPDPGLLMIGSNLVVSPFPPELRDPRCRTYPRLLSFRTGPAHDQRQSEEHFSPGSRPRVYATFGTDFNGLAADLFETVLCGLAELEADVVATVGRDVDPRSIRAQPANIDLRRFVDQDELLPSCSLMVSHGGSGSLLGGLTHGLPMLLLPLGADQPFNAERGQALGFARVLDPLAADPSTVAAEVLKLLGSPDFRAAARQLQAEIEAQPTIASAAAAIEEEVLAQR